MEKVARQNQSAQTSDKKGKASTHVWIDNDFITRDNLLDNNYYSRSIMDDDIFAHLDAIYSFGLLNKKIRFPRVSPVKLA